jgi:drug/metabolite transporter (DMT)-like permease
VNAWGWILAAIGFSGVLVIVRPGSALEPAGIALALVLAGGNTAFHLLTRLASRTETAIALIFHVTAAGCVFFAVAAIPTLDGVVPTVTDLMLMVVLGVIFTVGHFLFGVAYRHAPATLIAPVNYMHFVWAGLLGWGVFGHVPDGWTMLGMALILVAGVALAFKAHFETRRLRVNRSRVAATEIVE